MRKMKWNEFLEVVESLHQRALMAECVAEAERVQSDLNKLVNALDLDGFQRIIENRVWNPCEDGEPEFINEEPENRPGMLGHLQPQKKKGVLT